MQPANKLPLLREALSLMIDELHRDDTVGIVVYAGASGIVLSPTNNKDVIRSSIDGLMAGGGTNGAAGIEAAYQLAEDTFVPGGINRVILATDGDFNVGVTSHGDLQRLIEEKAKSGVFLTVLGFGMGNLKDGTLETLADKGNGNYAYIDTLSEAQKVLIEQMEGTLVTIAKDVKIQLEFNPLAASAYRLIGYENRMLAAQDFNDDKKDAGEIGAGHTVTALYEIVPAGQDVDVPLVDELKYQTVTEYTPAADSGELMTVKLRYKEPDGDESKLIEVPVQDSGATFAQSSDDFAFAASVAAFGMLLRHSEHVGPMTFAAVAEFAEGAKGQDLYGYRAEFIDLVRKAESIASAPR
jgi:Ca-activated chloride channel family protein